MKSFISGKSIVCALGLCVLIGATSARAQEYSARADVPFQFLAGGKLYAAGDYRFTVDGAVHTLKIQSQTNSVIGMVPMIPASERRSGPALDKGMVRFTTAGGLHVLNGIWRDGSSDGNVIYPSKAAKEALASRGNARETPSASRLDPR